MFFLDMRQGELFIFISFGKAVSEVLRVQGQKIFVDCKCLFPLSDIDIDPWAVHCHTWDYQHWNEGTPNMTGTYLARIPRCNSRFSAFSSATLVIGSKEPSEPPLPAFLFLDDIRFCCGRNRGCWCRRCEEGSRKRGKRAGRARGRNSKIEIDS
jgi:hypothetical protein